MEFERQPWRVASTIGALFCLIVIVVAAAAGVWALWEYAGVGETVTRIYEFLTS